MRRSAHWVLSGLLLLGLTACRGQQPAVPPAQSAIPAQATTVVPAKLETPEAVLAMAEAHIVETIAAYEKNGRFTVTAHELLAATRIYEGTLLPEASIEVYRLEYRLKPEHPDEVPLAGGMTLDEEGWLLQYQSPGSPCLVVKNEDGTRHLLWTDWDGEVGLFGGWEGYLGRGLVQRGQESGDEVMENGGWLAIARSKLYEAEAAMAPFLGLAPTEGEAVSDKAGHVWQKLSGYEKNAGQRMDDQLLRSLYNEFNADLVNNFFARYVYSTDPIVKERDGGLYVRADGSKLLGWDYTIDLSTLRIDAILEEEGCARFSAEGTGHGKSLRWQFELAHWCFDRYYTLAAPHLAVLPEFAVDMGGAWFGLGSETTPVALGKGIKQPEYAENIFDTGAKWRTDFYDGVTVTCWDKLDGKTGRVEKLEMTRGKLPTWRGIQIGDTRAQVLAAYPEILPEERQANPLWYQAFPGKIGPKIGFYFDAQEGLVRMSMQDTMD